MKKIILTIILGILSLPVFADVQTLPRVRVTYRPDGGVSITTFVAGSCQGETETECMDREMQKNPELANLPYDDIDPSTLPQDRKDRDKWRGAKGQGISIDHSLVTKGEQMQALENKLDEELGKNNPDSVKVAKIQRMIERVKKLNGQSNLIPSDKLAEFNPDNNSNKSLLASVSETVSIITNTLSSTFTSILQSIQDGFLALQKLTTNTIQIGSSENPSGITTYDQNTKQPYCIVIKDGQLQSLTGECGTINNTNAIDASTTTSEN